MLENLVCTIESVIFHSSDAGFSILHASTETKKDITILVNMVEVNIGITIDAEGEWVDNKRYGRQFKVSKWEEVLPTTLRGIEKYLSSGLIKGIGPATAKQIVKMFGEDSLNIIDKHSESLLNIKGLGRSRAEMIWSSWDKQRGIRDVMVFLKKYDIGTGIGVKIFKHYGDDSIEQLQTNPYRLVYDVDGIGFPTADAIALKLGFSTTDPLRLSSAIVYILDTHCEEGDTYIEAQELINKSVTLLSITSEFIQNAIVNLIDNDELIEEGSKLFLPKLYRAEKGIADILYDKANAPSPYLLDEEVINVEELERFTNIEYEDEQKDAIRKSVCSNVIVITGGPGTGKTTITHGIVTALHNMGMSILLAAPTGKAADRMSDATGFEAKTIHRLLGALPDGGYKHNENNPLSGDILIVDEVSMVNVYLMYSLLKSVPSNMRVILIGDVDQLPCIGPGNILKDIITSDTIPVIRLTKIFRQAQDSKIILNAYAINRGEVPTISNKKDSDFFFINEEEEDIPQSIIKLVSERLPKAYNVNPKDIQVLTPMKKYSAGTIMLNTELQSIINPEGASITHGSTIFRVGDKVIQTKNNYDKNIFNGDSGIITQVNVEDKTLMVDYGDSLIFYESDELDELLLAYALTIHKSQGSEYPIVVVPIANSHYFMLSKNLIYTGITRAKKLCVLVGSRNALAYGIKNVRLTQRKTMLKERLKELKAI